MWNSVLSEEGKDAWMDRGGPGHKVSLRCKKTKRERQLLYGSSAAQSEVLEFESSLASEDLWEMWTLGPLVGIHRESGTVVRPIDQRSAQTSGDPSVFLSLKTGVFKVSGSPTECLFSNKKC